MTTKRPPAPQAGVTIATVCEVLNLSERRVSQLCKEGLPKAAHGRYDLAAAAGWYIRYLQQIVEKNPRVQRGVQGTSVAIEKARNLALDSERRELELQKARGDLISVGDQAALWEDAVLRARSRALSAIDGHLDEIIEAKTRPRARDAAQAVLREFLDEVVRLGDDIEGEEGSPEASSEGEGSKKRPSGGGRRPRARRRREGSGDDEDAD